MGGQAPAPMTTRLGVVAPPRRWRWKLPRALPLTAAKTVVEVVHLAVAAVGRRGVAEV